MKTIFVVQPIFAPDKKRLERNLKSLETIFKYVRKYDVISEIDIKLLIGGWAINEEFWDIIDKRVSEWSLNTIKPKRFDKNYGKAYTLNSLVNVGKQSNPKFDYILSIDSDILFPKDNVQMFERLINAAEKITKIKKKPFGVLGLNQLEHCCHFKTITQNRKTIKYEKTETFGDWKKSINDGKLLEINNNINDEVVWPNNPSGIAGGCVLISRKLWDTVGGYRVMGVYAGDDAYLLLDCHNRGFTYQVIKSIGIIHPFDDDDEYQKWKGRVCHRDSGPIKNDISKQINEAEEFWRKR